MKKIGVTGTREGMSALQILQVYDFLETVEQPAELHHGDCAGVDEQVAILARGLGFRIVCHPPASDYLRAFQPADEMRVPAGYLKRDRAIVDSVDFMIVVPLQNEWQPKGGTWYTHDYAKTKGVNYKVFWPGETNE